MNLLLINPYDYRTVQSNPGLLSLLHVLEAEKIRYAMTVPGPVFPDGFKYVEMPANTMEVEANNVAQLRSRLSIDELTHIIAIDPEGAMVALRLLEMINRRDIRCSYISYEILFKNEIIFTQEQRLKEFDFAFLRLCREVLIQDEVRGEMFRRETGFDGDLFHAPVSPHQYLGANPDRDAFRKSLGLPLDKKILIYSGALDAYAKPDWWVEITECLPESYIFLFISFDGRQFNDPSLARIGRVLSAKGNARFIRNELPAVKYMQLLRACDAGIAFFRSVYTHWMNGRNIRQMGLSSGKFCNYVSCGLPVICDRSQDQFRRLAEAYPVVQAISAPEEVPSRLKLLSEMKGETESWCKKLFHDVLSPLNGIQNYLSALGR
jgi:hypothetical protein